MTGGFVFVFIFLAAANRFLLARDSLKEAEEDAAPDVDGPLERLDGPLESKELDGPLESRREGRGGSSEVVKTSSSL